MTTIKDSTRLKYWLLLFFNFLQRRHMLDEMFILNLLYVYAHHRCHILIDEIAFFANLLQRLVLGFPGRWLILWCLLLQLWCSQMLRFLIFRNQRLHAAEALVVLIAPSFWVDLFECVTRFLTCLIYVEMTSGEDSFGCIEAPKHLHQWFAHFFNCLSIVESSQDPMRFLVRIDIFE